MKLIDVGETAHFFIRYDQTIGAHAAARAQAVLATCESDLAKVAYYLPYSMGGGGDPYISDHRIVVQVVDLIDNRGGANNSHTGSVHPFHTIKIGAINSSGGEISDDFARFLFIAELAEVLMLAYGWNPGVSSGEALSRVMAEQLYPAQASTVVNAWFSDPARRYTYIVQDEFSDKNFVTFGIGILYINYLRSQLGYSLRDICGSGGVTLLDRYRNLTGHPDEDGAAPFQTLLNKHFPAGTSLPTNNPFPLYDAGGRAVSVTARAVARQGLSVVSARDLVTSAIVGRRGAEEQKTVHLSPFIGCPEQGYTYYVVATSRRLEVFATAVGFGLPRFTWRVNGHALTWASDSVTVSAKVAIDDPAHPEAPRHTTENFAFSYTHADEFSFAGLSNRLVIDNSSYGGHYTLDIEVSVQDQFDPAGSSSATTSTSTLMDTLAVVYEQRYYTDRTQCAARIGNAVKDHNRGLAKVIDLVKTLPDPPEPAVVRALLSALSAVRQELVGGGADQQVARDAAHLVAGQLGVPVNVLNRALGIHH